MDCGLFERAWGKKRALRVRDALQARRAGLDESRKAPVTTVTGSFRTLPAFRVAKLLVNLARPRPQSGSSGYTPSQSVGGIARAQDAPPRKQKGSRDQGKSFSSPFSLDSRAHSSFLFPFSHLNLTRPQSSRQETFPPSPLFQVGSAYPHKISLISLPSLCCSPIPHIILDPTTFIIPPSPFSSSLKLCPCRLVSV